MNKQPIHHLKSSLVIFIAAFSAAALAGGFAIAFASLTLTGTGIQSDQSLNLTGNASGTVNFGSSTIAFPNSSGTLITTNSTATPSNGQALLWSASGWTPGNVSSSASSDETVDASASSGANWLAKVNAAVAALGSNGGTVIIPDSIAGDGSATTGTIPSNVTLRFSGSATFTFCSITIGTYSKIYNDGDALLQMKSSGSGCAGINSTSSASMQTNDKLVLSGIRVDCNAQASSTGVSLSGGSAEVVMEGNWSISNCGTVGLYLGAIQFGEFSGGHLWQNQVGLKIYASSGGGSSNDFYGTQIVNSVTCDVVINNQSGGADAMYADYFYNSNIQSAADCGMAVIGANVHWLGGAPEHQNQGGTATSTTIDGATIQPASIYLNNAYFSFTDGDIQDFQISPEINATNGSNVVLQNMGGYGTSAKFVLADSTSKVQMVGTWYGQGIINNVTEYPSIIIPPGFGVEKLLGSPILQYNLSVPNFYTGNPVTPTLQSCVGGASCGTALDPFYGTVSTVSNAASTGNQDSNRFLVNNPFGASLSGNQDYLISFLIKSNVNSDYQIGYYGDNNTQASTRVDMNLVAGQWQRFVMVVGNKASNYAGTGLVGFPKDTSGPTISITGLEALAAPAGSLQGQQYTAAVLESGSVNPNGYQTQSVGNLTIAQTGGHLNLNATSSDVAGTITISSATSSSHAFGTAWSSAPNCELTPTSNPASIGTYWVTASTASVVANVSSTGSITFVYHCFGAPN